MDQLALHFTTPQSQPLASAEYLTIAEAARRVRCCERTIRARSTAATCVPDGCAAAVAHAAAFGPPRPTSTSGCIAMPRKRAEPAVEVRRYMLSDGTITQTYSVRWFDAAGIRRRETCASLEEADFERARVVLEQSRNGAAVAAAAAEPVLSALRRAGVPMQRIRPVFDHKPSVPPGRSTFITVQSSSRRSP